MQVQETSPSPTPVQEIPIRPLIIKAPDRTIIERTFVEREPRTEPLPVPPIHIEVPATPPPAAAPHVTIVNVPSERTRDENQRIRGEDTLPHGTPGPETERIAEPAPNISPVAQPPTEQAEPEQKMLAPEPEKCSSGEQKNIPVADKPVEKKRSNGKPGRKNTELQHAINWILWEQTGFDKKRCPWKNPYECRKHQPPDENLIEARRFLDFDF